MKYPKMNSLWKREGWYYDENLKKNTSQAMQKNRQKFIEGDYACAEFANIKNWIITEKIDGMNIRIHYIKGAQVSFAGRTDNAMLPPKLLSYLQAHFTLELMESVFKDAEEVLLFGEGYGAKIQCGGYYSKEQRFCLFDVYIDKVWWMEHKVIEDMADDLGIPCAPLVFNGYSDSIFSFTTDEIVDFVKSKPLSLFAEEEHVMEGVVAKTEPLLRFRNGTPLKFKLKVKDFR